MANSRSQSASTQTTNQQDNRIAAADNAIAVGAGATLVQETVSDTIATAAIEGSVDAAKSVVKEGADLVRDVQGQSLNFATDTVRSSQAIAEASLESAQDTVRSNVELAGLAIQNLEKNKRDPNDDTLQTLSKTATVGVVVIVLGIGAFLIFRKK